MFQIKQKGKVINEENPNPIKTQKFEKSKK